VDGELQAKGRRWNGPDVTIPPDVFAQTGVAVTWWDTIEADHIASWQNVRFRYSDVLRLWSAQQSEPPETTEPQQAGQTEPPSSTRASADSAGLADSTPQAALGAPARNPRGPRPHKRDQIAARMQSDYGGDFDALRAEKEEALASTYGASRDTVRKARGQVLTNQTPTKPQQITTIDK
jgi:hypothetical protein